MRNVGPLPRHVTWRFRRFTRPSATKLLPRLLGSTDHSRLPSAAQRPSARSPTRASPTRRCTSPRSSSFGSVTTTCGSLGARRRERRPPRRCTSPSSDVSESVATTCDPLGARQRERRPPRRRPLASWALADKHVAPHVGTHHLKSTSLRRRTTLVARRTCKSGPRHNA